MKRLPESTERKRKENGRMVNLTCPCPRILVCRCEAKKWVPLWVNLWTKPANRYGSYEIRGGGDGSGRDTSGPEIAFRAIACGSTEVITRQSHLPQNCKSFIRHNDPRAITSCATYGRGFVIARTDSQAVILRPCETKYSDF